MKARTIAGAALAALLSLTSTTFGTDPTTLFGNVQASNDHTILLTALKEAGLVNDLSADGANTLFAPTDEAFKKLGEEQIKKLVADKDLLRKLVLAHVVQGTALTSNDLKKRKELNGFTISAKDGVKIGNAKIVIADRKCSNGIMHVIDTVLIPK